MYLSRLYIKNYKSIQETDISFEKGKNIIVGRNNSGKSNIVSAIDLLLGENSPTWNKSENITEHHFFKGKTEQPIFIWCELSLSEADEKFNFLSVSNLAFFRVKKDYNNHNIQIVDNFDDKKIKELFYFQSEEGSQKIENKEYQKEWIGGKNYCNSDFNSEFADIKKIAFAFLATKNENDVIEKYLGFFYTDDKINWSIGIGGEKMRNIFLQSAVIPSFRDPQTQLKINNWSWYSKLLKQYIKPSKELNDAFQNVKNASDNIFDDLKKQVCDSKINIAFPGTKISFQFNPNSKQDVYKNALIYVDDGFNSQINEKGSGIQSAVIIGLFDFYIRNIAHACCSLLGHTQFNQ
ncbi:MAG: AAA family ATPase [bacterium]